jgi:hypothetical protein
VADLHRLDVGAWPWAIERLASKPDLIFDVLKSSSEWYPYGQMFRDFEIRVRTADDFKPGGRLAENLYILQNRVGILRPSGPKHHQVKQCVPDYFVDVTFHSVCWTLYEYLRDHLELFVEGENGGGGGGDMLFRFLQQHVAPVDDGSMEALQARVREAISNESGVRFGVDMLLSVLKTLVRGISRNLLPGREVMTALEQLEAIAIVLDLAATTRCYA